MKELKLGVIIYRV